MNTIAKRAAISISIVFIILVINGRMWEVSAGKCDNAAAPQVEIQISKSEIQEAYDMKAADIQRLAESTGKQPSWPGLGVSNSDTTYSAAISENVARERDGSYCATADHVQIVIALKNRVIHLARELKEKPCLERIQKERLLKLARAYEQALDEFPIGPEMRSLLRALRPSRAKLELAAKAQVTSEVRQKIQTLLAKIESYASEISRKMNSPEEEIRVRREVESDQHCR